MRIRTYLPLVAALAVAAACGGSPDPEQPVPQAGVDSAAMRARARQDSIDAENRRRAEEEARRAEADRLAREASERASAVRNDLTAMINFDYNEANIRSEDQANLDRKAAILQANPSVRIRVSGHADERGSDEYNLALGNRRAAAAERYLTNKGIDGARIDVISFGEERPIAAGADEGAYAQNRRDEFEILSGGDTLVAPQ
ncbi:MAG TPA: OmpA family protein [Gemmatimonadales bacterium]